MDWRGNLKGARFPVPRLISDSESVLLKFPTRIPNSPPQTGAEAWGAPFVLLKQVKDKAGMEKA